MSLNLPEKTDGNDELDPVTGLIKHARQVPSPNYDERPQGMQIEALIIHAISLPPCEFGDEYIEQFFCNRLPVDEHPYFREIAELRVSSHFLIKREGELLQFVSVNNRAWHAGVSCCMGREAVNDFSVGIELEGCDDEGFEELQYRTLHELTRTLVNSIPALAIDNIYGHSDISPGRKTDPGPGFDWERYRIALRDDERIRYA